MGVLDNLKKIKKARDNKNAVAYINRDAVRQGAIENIFLDEYNSFSVALKEVLDKAFTQNKYTSITLGAVKDPEGNNARYLNYVLNDEEYTTLYHMEKDIASNITFKQKYIDLDEDSFGKVLDSTYQPAKDLEDDFLKDVRYFLED